MNFKRKGQDISHCTETKQNVGYAWKYNGGKKSNESWGTSKWWTGKSWLNANGKIYNLKLLNINEWNDYH